MRMLTVTTDFLPNGGGLARYADALCRIVGDEMRVMAYVNADEAARRDVVRQAPYRLEYRGLMRRRWPRWWPMVGWMRASDADVVVVHQVLPCGVAARLSRKPYVVCLHGMDVESAMRRPRQRALMRWTLRGADTIVANSRSLAARVQTLTGREAVVCYPQPWLVGNPREHTGRDDGRVELISIARLVERKGIARVLAFLRDRADMVRRVHYTIAGVGAYASTLRSLIESYDLASCVTLLETQEESALRDVYRRADVFVLPTMSLPGDVEGFGIVYLEAATFGIPSIASRVAGVSEAVVHRETGILAGDDTELSKAICELVDDVGLRQRLGDAARRRAELFSPKRQFAPLLERYGTH